MDNKNCWLLILLENILYKGTQLHIMSDIWLTTKNVCVNMKKYTQYQLERENEFKKEYKEILKIIQQKSHKYTNS